MSASAPTCAYCQRHVAVTEFFPFCSQRCRMADLGQWLSGSYRVTGTADDALESRDDEAGNDEPQEKLS